MLLLISSSAVIHFWLLSSIWRYLLDLLMNPIESVCWTQELKSYCDYLYASKSYCSVICHIFGLAFVLNSALQKDEVVTSIAFV